MSKSDGVGALGRITFPIGQQSDDGITTWFRPEDPSRMRARLCKVFTAIEQLPGKTEYAHHQNIGAKSGSTTIFTGD
jgi:hypothetical protein